MKHDWSENRSPNFLIIFCIIVLVGGYQWIWNSSLVYRRQKSFKKLQFLVQSFSCFYRWHNWGHFIFLKRSKYALFSLKLIFRLVTYTGKVTSKKLPLFATNFTPTTTSTTDVFCWLCTSVCSMKPFSCQACPSSKVIWAKMTNSTTIMFYQSVDRIAMTMIFSSQSPARCFIISQGQKFA